MGFYWVPGVRGIEIADELARGGSALGFLGHEPPLGICRRDVQEKLSRWFVNKQWTIWQGLVDTQRQDRDLIT